MNIYLTGDTHGRYERFDKKFVQAFGDTKSLPDFKPDDIVIVTGDCGVLFSPLHVQLDTLASSEEVIKEVGKLPFTLAYVDGNHENFELTNEFPIEQWNGGKIHRISDNCIHLMRGQVFNINGKRIFTFGGARSTDKIYRQEHISWWSEEMPSEAEEEEATSNIELAGWKVDYAITHCAPSGVQFMIDTYYETDACTNFLNSIAMKLDFERWYFGHYHENRNISDKYTLLYESIIKLGDKL